MCPLTHTTHTQGLERGQSTPGREGGSLLPTCGILGSNSGRAGLATGAFLYPLGHLTSPKEPFLKPQIALA